MDRGGKSRGFAVLVTSVLLVFFFAVMTYAWLEVLDLDASGNFLAGMVFWVLNCLVLLSAMVGQFYLRMGVPFRVAVVAVTWGYTVFEVLLLAFGLSGLGGSLFVLLNLLLLLVYLAVVVPVMIMGGKSE